MKKFKEEAEALNKSKEPIRIKHFIPEAEYKTERSFVSNNKPPAVTLTAEQRMELKKKY